MPKTQLLPFTTKEWRCTRHSLYAKGTAPKSMEGHYIAAETEAMARAKMAEKFPEDGGQFNAELWSQSTVVYLTPNEFTRRTLAQAFG